jgi:hypothetical protein
MKTPQKCASSCLAVHLFNITGCLLKKMSTQFEPSVFLSRGVGTHVPCTVAVHCPHIHGSPLACLPWLRDVIALTRERETTSRERAQKISALCAAYRPATWYPPPLPSRAGTAPVSLRPGRECFLGAWGPPCRASHLSIARLVAAGRYVFRTGPVPALLGQALQGRYVDTTDLPGPPHNLLFFI